MTGYSSFPEWKKLSEIKEDEVEDRGNVWFDDEKLNLDEYIGKWVCLDPKYALWYLVRADFHGLDPEKHEKPEHSPEKEWIKFKKMWLNPKAHVCEIDITGATQVLEDPDHGFLYIKKV